jgi:hypothetical protein
MRVWPSGVVASENSVRAVFSAASWVAKTCSQLAPLFDERQIPCWNAAA